MTQIKVSTTQNPTQLLYDIRRGMWLIDRHESVLPIAVSFLKGEPLHNLPITQEHFTAQLYASNYGGEQSFDSSTESSTKQVAVIPITGAIAKYDSCYSFGAMTIARAIEEAAELSSVCAIVLDIDSCGGACNAIAPIKEAILKVKAMGKPIIAHVDLCASLAYWIASQCDAIFCDNNMSELGSIGALVHLQDATGAYRKEGWTVETIYAKESPDKNISYREAIDGKFDKMLGELSQLVAFFHNDVKASRPTLSIDAEGVLSGAMFFADEAVKLGLANGVLTLRECIENATIRATTKF